jgi:hypothetical protein
MTAAMGPPGATSRHPHLPAVARAYPLVEHRVRARGSPAAARGIAPSVSQGVLRPPFSVRRTGRARNGLGATRGAIAT